MKDGYLEPTDEGAFLDFVKREKLSYYPYECPKCKGHGGWNLKINCYPLHGRSREFGHFRCVCHVCNGSGYTPTENPCDHDWKFEQNLGRCYNRYRCLNCNNIMDVDSSD